MSKMKVTNARRQKRVRLAIRRTANGRPRLSVFRSSKHIYAQVIDDLKGETLASASSLEKDLRAKGDMQTYRVELPGPKVSKGRGEDERCRVEIDRQQFNQLADDKSTIGSYRRAAETGHIRFEGDSNVAKLVIRVIEAHEQRAKLKKVH